MNALLLLTVLGWLSLLAAGVLAFTKQWRWSIRATLIAAAGGVVPFIVGSLG
jgi:hypothetical protein